MNDGAPDYAEALRLIRKHKQPGDTIGKMFIRVAKSLEEPKGKSEWQPIETAPKDGTDIVVGCSSKHSPLYAIVQWDDTKHGWMMWWKMPVSYADWATKWMPLK